MKIQSQPLNIELIQEQKIIDHKKLNRLGTLYDLRESESSNLRWGVKSKEIKLPTFFSSLRESLKVKRKGRLK
tara:strand:+ start:286 stop:504 length:219 start_codon:yes stop_codon:yes gene_type:complete